MRSSYLDYAMSVIVGRALPDVRDGLKPVHRRVLWGMHESGMQPNRPYKKSANVVGYVMGNYHPHGDSAIYDTLVRMAQPFSLRYPLVDGQGNFGSIDDDPPAAMRYTECRLPAARDRDAPRHRHGHGRLRAELRRVPQGAVGRSRRASRTCSSTARPGSRSGMATNMPPHHLGESIDAVVQLIDKPDANVEDLMKHVKGPDFPTGAIVVGRSGIRDAYRTGRGRIVMRARAHVEELRGGKSAIVVTELPYGVKKGGDSGVIKKIADLVNDKVITEVSDLADHSDKTGMRIQIELKRDAIPQVVLNKLFKHTALQSTFGYNAVALVGGVPKTLSLLELVRYYLDYQREIVTRRSKYELRQAEKRAHILQGYLIALDNLDAVIAPDPRVGRHRGGADRPPGDLRPQRGAGAGDPRPPARAAHRARAEGDRGRVRRPPGADRRAPRDPGRPGPHRRPDPRGAPRDQADLRRSRTTAAPRSSRARTRSSSRT